MRGRVTLLFLIFIGVVLGASGVVLTRQPHIAEKPVAVTPVTARPAAAVRFASVGLPVLPRIEAFGPPPPPVLPHDEAVSHEDVPDAAKSPPVTEEKGGAKVVVIIDDMGMDVAHSRAMMALPGRLTLSFLPYAPRVAGMAAEASRTGHELMIHMPMEAVNRDLDLGGIALREGMSDADFNAMLDRAFASFRGYAGMNNHMGSRLTQDRHAMALVMAALRKRGLFFVDSRTIASSVAADEAMKAGVPWASRDVFLDDADNAAAVRRQLRVLEDTARRRGVAVAIGHPRAATVEALRGWLPTLAAKGIAVVPVGAILKRPQSPVPPPR